MPCHQEATAIYAVPAERIGRGFRLLLMREFRAGDAPPAFAVIEQQILRSPERRNRHGVSFATAFLPEIMDWLITELGRPAQRQEGAEARRNPRWPAMSWHPQTHTWPDGLQTIEWYVDIAFADEASCAAFERRWQGRLRAESEEAAT
jgi:hypothetical protein